MMRVHFAAALLLGALVGAAHAGEAAQSAAPDLPFAFDRLGLHRIEAACLPHNEASRALLRKVGFREEGYGRRYLRIRGAWQDHVLYAIMQDDPRPNT